MAAAVKQNILKGDTVMLRRGREKGKRGTVKAVFPRAGKATVEGLNVVKRHTKGSGDRQRPGGILEKEAPLPLSALMYVCGKCNLPTRIKRNVSDSRSQRVCLRCAEPAREAVKA
ncbi:MAG: 50S ribosomal protein L24 [Candidatus Eremiobacteraeota bacterium]|nr:50S ribosomal protein L24 [Candidatus Eremiobacteraeota bacterium]